MVFDFAQPLFPLPAEFPDPLRTQLQLNADAWDGFPDQRQAVIDLLAEHNAALISGDIHASFVSGHRATNGRAVPEFTGTSVSSESYQEELGNQVRNDPTLAAVPGVETLLAGADLLLLAAATRLPETDLLSSGTAVNGYVVMEADEDALRAVYRHWPAALVEQDWTSVSGSGVLAGELSENRFSATTAPGGGMTVEAVAPNSTNFRLQLLHASDLEGGVEAIQDAPNFAALVERFGQTDLPTIVISAGDNYIPGPFFSAAADERPAWGAGCGDRSLLRCGRAGQPRGLGAGRCDHHEPDWL